MATLLSLLCSTVSRSEINSQDFISTEGRGRQSNEKTNKQTNENQLQSTGIFTVKTKDIP